MLVKPSLDANMTRNAVERCLTNRSHRPRNHGRIRATQSTAGRRVDEVPLA